MSKNLWRTPSSCSLTQFIGQYSFSQKTSCISLWGPTDPSHLSRSYPENIEIYKELYCSPCLHHADKPPCKGNNICMKNITALELIEKIQLFNLP